MTSKIAPELIDSLEDSDSINTSDTPGINVQSVLNALSGKINVIGAVGGGGQILDLNLGRVITATITVGPTTFTFSNPLPAGNEDGIILYLTDGGAFSTTFPGVLWANAALPTLTVSGVDVILFQTLDGGSTWYGFLSGSNMS